MSAERTGTIDTETTDIGGTLIEGTVTYDGTASISVRIADSVVAAGQTLTIDATALTGVGSLAGWSAVHFALTD